MKLVIIFGPHAVGKMTVGQELSKITGLKLFHNHMTIELVTELFKHDPAEYRRLVNLFRQEIFDAYSKSEEYGLIFTYMWAFDSKGDWDYIENLEQLFQARGACVYYVELEADYDLRLERNQTENRLLHKPSKRDIAYSEQMFKSLEAKYRLNSTQGELKKERYIRIDNSCLPPDAVARMIKEGFQL